MNTKTLLLLLLRFLGVVALSALVGVLMPTSWMVVTHRWMGLGEMSTHPVVEYLARSLSAFHVFLGALCLVLASNVERYLSLIGFLGVVFFLGGNLYGHLPRNRNAMVVDGLGGATRIVGGCRDVLAGPCHQTGKEPAQGKGMQLGPVNVTARLSVTLECTCETDAEQSDAAELWSARNLKSTSTATTR